MAKFAATQTGMPQGTELVVLHTTDGRDDLLEEAMKHIRVVVH